MSQPDKMPAARSLARVARGDLCAGCGACAAIAGGRIEMVTEAPGYLRPRQTAALSRDEDDAIARVCPGLHHRVETGGRRSDPLWGPFREVLSGWARDPALRHAGSSGGALSAVLDHLLESGTVDGVLHTAADPDLAIGNRTVLSTDAGAVRAAAGSRYAPSAPLADLRGYLASGKRHAFVGKPCDVAALRRLMDEDAAYSAAFPVVVSFFCAGVPSHSGGWSVVSALGAAPADVTSFRYRGHGWPGRATALLRDGSERSMSYHDSWGKILTAHVQHRCKICADGTGMSADIVFADAWETDEKGYPVFEEAEGVSLIVTRTSLGAEILTAARAAGHLETADFDFERLRDIQPGQRDRRRAVLARLLALRLCGRPVPRYEGLQLWDAAWQNTVARNLRNFLGMIRRVVRDHGRWRRRRSRKPLE